MIYILSFSSNIQIGTKQMNENSTIHLFCPNLYTYILCSYIFDESDNDSSLSIEINTSSSDTEWYDEMFRKLQLYHLKQN